MFSFLKSRSRGVLLAAGVVAVVGAPAVAVGAGEGSPLDGGARNPANDARQNYTKETEVIANVDTYGTRQSNKSDNGGGAVYGCRSKAGGTAAKNEPCLRATNLNVGSAFEFNSGGVLGGLITVGKGGDGAKPFTTNATGVATGLNADRVDGRSGEDLLGKTEKAADADKVDGVDGSDLARNSSLLYARVAGDGTTVQSARPNSVSATVVDADTTRLTFPTDVDACSFTATQSEGGTPTALSAVPTSGNARAVDVSSAAADLPAFNLQGIC